MRPVRFGDEPHRAFSLLAGAAHTLAQRENRLVDAAVVLELDAAVG